MDALDAKGYVLTACLPQGYEVVKSTCYDAELRELPVENAQSETCALIRR